MRSTYFFRKPLRFILQVALVAAANFSTSSMMAVDAESIRCFAMIGGENRIATVLTIVSKAQDFDSEVNMKIFRETEDGEELIGGKRQKLVPEHSTYARAAGLRMHSVFIEIYFAGDDVSDDELAVEVSPFTGNLVLPSGTRLREPGKYYVVFEWAEGDLKGVSIAKFEFSVLDSSYLGSEILVIDN